MAGGMTTVGKGSYNRMIQLGLVSSKYIPPVRKKKKGFKYEHLMLTQNKKRVHWFTKMAHGEQKM